MCTYPNGPLDFDAIRPQVLILQVHEHGTYISPSTGVACSAERLHGSMRLEVHLCSGTHGGACLCCAVLLQGAVEHVYGIEEVHCIDCEPLIDIFAKRQAHCLLQISTPERGIDVALERCPLRGQFSSSAIATRDVCTAPSHRT